MEASYASSVMPAVVKEHLFYALAFEENFTLRELAQAFPGAKVSGSELHLKLPSGGWGFVYSFGAVVFEDVTPEDRADTLANLQQKIPRLTAQVIFEQFNVREQLDVHTTMHDGALVVDKLTPARAAVVALTVAQSAAMEYYERIVDALFERTNSLVERLQNEGTVQASIRALHRFIGEAIATRTEVLSVLHLLDKPDATWDDPVMDEIYGDLRDEFDLVDRYESMEFKLRSIQEGLELILDVARDRRLVILEATIVILIIFEIVMGILQLK